MTAAATGASEADGAAAFPWDEAMGLAFGVLRLSPEAFWRMTPRELAGALSPFAARTGEPMRRAALDELIKRYPDGR